MRIGTVAVVLGLACGVACSDPVDRAAKARIFSPEAPPQVVASALEPLPVDHLGDDARLTRRVLTMGAAEATERLGSFRYHASTRFQWTAPAALQLSEERALVAGAGGVGGDFHATVNNTRDQGLEVLRAGGRVFARSRYGTFRERKRDRGMGERAREEVFAALRDLTGLFDERVKLDSQGTVTYQGRSATRFVASLGPTAADTAPRSDLPPPTFAKNGADESSRRRLSFFEHRQPQTLSGEVWVDSQTSVVLKAKLEGTLRVPDSPGSRGGAVVQVSVESQITDPGKVGALTPPKDFLPDTDKPPGIAEALERFGIRARDAGTAAESEEDGS